MFFPGDLAIEGLATWLPDRRQTAEEAVTAGLIDPEAAAATGALEVPVSDGISAPEMAAKAGRLALERAGTDPAAVALLVHGHVYHQGHDLWSPGHFIADQAGASSAIPFSLLQMSHGGAMALHTAADHLTAHPEARTAMVTTADRFTEPGFDRWRCESNIVFGDGATAAVLGRSGRGLRLVSHAVVGVPELEGMYREGDAFSLAPLAHSSPIDGKRPKKAFLAAGGGERFAHLAPRKIREVVTTALADADLDPHDPAIRNITLSRMGPKPLEMQYLPVVEDLLKADVLHLGTRTGHLGCGDVLANLADLTEQRLLEPGEYTLALSGGAGHTWSCLIVQQL